MSLTEQFTKEANAITPSLALSDLQSKNAGFYWLPINGANCSFGPVHGDDGVYQRLYTYDIHILFKDKASGEAFANDPNAYAHGTTIAKTAQELLQSTFDLEADRDTNPVYDDENINEKTMIETLTSGTQGDVEVVEDDITKNVQHAFPDAGIAGIKIVNPIGLDQACYPSNGSPFASIEWPQEQPQSQQIATLNNNPSNNFVPGRSR